MLTADEADGNLIDPGKRDALSVGDICLLPPERRVSGPSASVMVEPRVMQVLLALADADGRVVTRDRLLEMCWGPILVGEDSLNRAVAGARRALREAGSVCVSIQTIPKIGYQLPFKASERPSEPPAPAPQPAERRREGALDRRTILAGVLASTSGIGVFAYMRSAKQRQERDSLVQAAQTELRAMAFGHDSHARGMLERAISLDEDNSEAWGLLAVTWQRSASNAHGANILAAQNNCKDAADTALALDRLQGNAHAALALLDPIHGNWLEAEQRIDNVLQIAPESAFALAGKARILQAVGRSSAALATAEQLAGLHPDCVAGRALRIHLTWATGAQDRALALARLGWTQKSSVPGIAFVLPWLLLFSGDTEGADGLFAEIQQKNKQPSRILTSFRSTVRAVQTGERSDAETAERQLISLGKFSGPPLTGSFLGLAALNRLDSAFELASATYRSARAVRPGDVETLAYRYRQSNTAFFLPPLSAFRADPRFPVLCERMGLADYWRLSGARADHLRGTFLPMP